MEAGAERWAVNTRMWTPSEAQFAAFVDLLSVSERPQVLRYIRFEDRKRALVSRLLQRKLVHSLLKIAYEDIRIERTREGKPYLVWNLARAGSRRNDRELTVDNIPAGKSVVIHSAAVAKASHYNSALYLYDLSHHHFGNPPFKQAANRIESCPFPNLNFNVAHHGNYVVLASEPVCLVGVDIMTHDPTREESPLEFFEPFRLCYTKNEWNMVRSAGPTAGPLFDQFYRLWCLKEAYIKAVGIGLGFELTRAEFSHPGGDVWSSVATVRIDGYEKPHWLFSLRKLGGDHWVCVARGPPDEAVESYRETLQHTQFDPSAIASAIALPEKEFTLLEVWDLVPDTEKDKFSTFRT